MQSIINYIKHPSSLLDSLVRHFGQFLSDRTYIKLRFRLQMGKRLNLKNPKTFQEKIQWLKLYNYNPNYTKMVDKVLVKEYVSSIIGSEYVIPILGVWDEPESINWDILPNRFVLKTNHGGGNSGVVVCRDKNNFDYQKAKLQLSKSLHNDIYRNMREWPYKNIRKCVFAEEYVEIDSTVKDLPDYKWYCFNGEPMYCQVIKNRTTNETIDFFDKEWHHQDFIGLNPLAHNSSQEILRPSNLELHIKIAKKLSKSIPFCRVDLYDTGSKVYFGEITFFPASGVGFFKPEKYDEILGSLLTLPNQNYR